MKVCEQRLWSQASHLFILKILSYITCGFVHVWMQMPVDFRRRVSDFLSPEWQSGATLRGMGIELAFSARSSSAPHLLPPLQLLCWMWKSFLLQFSSVFHAHLTAMPGPFPSVWAPPMASWRSLNYLLSSLLTLDFCLLGFEPTHS